MKYFLLTLVVSASVLANEPNLKRQQELQNMLEHDCGSCHGLTFKGGLGPALLADSLRYKSDAFLVHTILMGRKGTAMPPWKPFLTESEALWMVKQLRKTILRAVTTADF